MQFDSNDCSHTLPYIIFLSFYLREFFVTVNGGHSFSTEVILPVNTAQLYALSMYDSLIGVAFDNAGGKARVISRLHLSYVMSYSHDT